jgi:hypothetical protein
MVLPGEKTMMPNFLIIGAAKGGTTALHYYLKQHPQIYMSPVKETKFFVFEGEKVNYRGPGDLEANRSVITNIQAYQAQFEKVTHEIAIGESSPIYLYSPKAPERIQHYIPNVKLIAILRNPADRAFSSFLHLIRDGREWLTDFEQALKEEEKRIADNWALLWYYKNAGFYYLQLKRYFDRFSPSQIRVYLYEDLNNSPIELIQDLFRFLEVDNTFVPNTSTRHNVSLIPKNKYLHEFLTQPKPIKSALSQLIPTRVRQRITTTLKEKNLTKPTLSPELRKELIEVYREDILKLQDLIGRDLSQWLE